MLPKPDKKSKNQVADQLPLVKDKPKKEPKVKDVKAKRIILLIILFLTVGLSIIFSFYHHFKNYSFSFTPAIPRLSFFKDTVTPVPNLENDIDSIIKSDSSFWSVYLISGNLIWSKNSDQLFSDVNQPDLIQQFNNTSFSDADLSWLGLPQGLHLKKIETAAAGYYRVSYQIVTPQKTLSLFIKISGADFKKSINLIPSVVSALYWKLI